MKKKLQTIIASALVVVVAAVPVFANVTGMMTSTSTTMTTTTVPVEPDEPDVPDDPKPEQNLPDYFIDLKDGLKTGEDYNGISVNVEAKVLEDKDPVEFTLGGESYTSLYTVQGSDPKASPNDGAVPTVGNYVKIVPEKDGTFVVVTNYIGNTGTDKTVWFVHEVAGGTPEAQSYTTSKTEADVKEYEVKAGETYYFYAKGSNAMIAGLGIRYEEKQNVPDYFIDLKDGLKVGEDYSGISVNVEAKVLEGKDPVEFTLGGENYTSLYTVQGSDPKASPNDGAVPTAGNYVKIVPEKDGTFVVVTNYIGNTGTDKTVWFVHEVAGGTPEAQSYTTSKTEADVKEYEVKAGETYYFYAKGSNAMIAGLGIKFAEDQTDTTVAVTDITGVVTKMTAGETITLTGTVVPANATNKTIVWSVKDAGTTGATISGDKLTAKTAGKVVVTATIAKGVSADKAFTKDFTIEVEAKAEEDKTVAVTDITGVVAEMTAGETVTLAGTVAPENATNKTIVWSVKDAGTTEATINGDQLTAQKAGTVVVTATIEKGVSATEAYTKDFTIEVKEAVKLGDANKDGSINSADALEVLKYDVQLIGESGLDMKAADVNKDGVVNSADALEILKHDVGLVVIQ